MCYVALIPIAAAIIGGAISADATDKAADQAAEASGRGNQAALRGVALQERQFAMEAPYRRRQLEAGIGAIGRGETLAEKELPLQLTVIDEAANAGMFGEQEAAAGRATADTHAAIDATAGTRARTLASLGIKPGDPAYTAGGRTADALNAATLAKASTDAREGERVRGMEQRIRVAGQARGFNPNVTTVANPGSSLVAAGNTLSQIGASQFTQAQQAAAAQQKTIGEIGKAAGSAFESIFNTPNTPPQTELSNSYNSTNFNLNSPYPDFEKGGEVRGPSHPDGGVPIEAEGGEFVIKADTVRKYGPRLLAEVNEGTAIIIPTSSPRRLKAVA